MYKHFLPIGILFLLVSNFAYARAGGGTEDISDGVLGIILMLFGLIAFALSLTHSQHLSVQIFGYLLLLIPIALFMKGYSFTRKVKSKKREVSETLIEMAAEEPRWSEENLIAIAEEEFTALQQAWGTQDLKTMQALLHPQLFSSWESQIKTQKHCGERNPMIGLSIKNSEIVDARNYIDDERDNFTVCFDASADDQVIKDEKLVASKKRYFREFWTFRWHEGKWLVYQITQASGLGRFVSRHIVYERKSSKKVA